MATEYFGKLTRRNRELEIQTRTVADPRTAHNLSGASLYANDSICASSRCKSG